MPTYTESAPILWRFQCDPTAAQECVVQAFFRTDIINNDDTTERLPKDAGSVSFTLPDDLAKAVIVLATDAHLNKNT